jgi:hypothetical protein
VTRLGIAAVESKLNSFFGRRDDGQRCSLNRNKCSYLNYYIYRRFPLGNFESGGVEKGILKCGEFRLCIMRETFMHKVEKFMHKRGLCKLCVTGPRRTHYQPWLQRDFGS